MTHKKNIYWKKTFGLEWFKIDYQFKRLLYKLTGLSLPKLKSQYGYWKDRGQVYMEEILASGYLKREIFFQDMMINYLQGIDFDSFFEAGCGFGWNIRRVKEEFPSTRVGGVDFSFGQLFNSKQYLEGTGIPVANGDNCSLPFRNNAFDVGFSLGVFMNIHPSKIESSVKEMIRVCSKYIIHLEYDEDHTTEDLRKKRAFKTNIVSHDYKTLYEKHGAQTIVMRDFNDFGSDFSNHCKKFKGDVDRWEALEGPEKYTFIVFKC